MAVWSCCLLSPHHAAARLSADASLQYTDFNSSNNKGEKISGNSLTQHYSLLYSKSGPVMDKRLGSYSLAVGYEWAAFDTSVSSNILTSRESRHDSRGHLLYSGEIFVDPKEIPLTFSAYSRDNSRISFQKSSQSLGSASTLLSDSFTTSINNGIHITNGATLVMGVKNGMTNGYNEFFRHIPMLFIDYKDEINKDLSASSPSNNRLSRLAFVSLNKKDNWFHYRMIRYYDYITPGSNYNETQLQLGTVDHLLQRRWIDFSNWIQVSVDGLNIRRKSQNNTDDYDEFSLNAYVRMRRQTWEAYALGNFSRKNEYNRGAITYKTNLPVYANGIISPTSSWSGYASFSDNHTTTGSTFRTMNSSYQVNSYQASKFTLTHGISHEYATNDAGTESHAIGANIGTSSTKRFSAATSLQATYSIRYYVNTTKTGETTFTDQVVSGSITQITSANSSVSLSQSNRFTSGQSSFVSSDIQGTGVNTPQYVDPRNNSLTGTGSYQSVTNATFSWRPMAQLDTSLSFQNDYFVRNNQYSDNIVRVYTRTTYRDRQLTLINNNTYTTSSNNYTNIREREPNQLKTDNIAQYVLNRNFDAKARLTYYKYLDVLDKTENFEFEESLSYSYYISKGLPRKLFVINQAFATSKEIHLNQPFSNRFSLSGSYYPLRQISLSAGTTYYFTDTFSDYTISYNASAAMSYRLLSASLDYTYGRTKLDGRIEKRFGASFKKSF